MSVCVPLCRPSSRAGAAGWSWSVRPTPAGCFRVSVSAAHTVLLSSLLCARCDWITPWGARPPAPTDPGCYLWGDRRQKITHVSDISRSLFVLFRQNAFVYHQFEAPSRPGWCLCGCVWRESRTSIRGILGGWRRAGGCWGEMFYCPEPYARRRPYLTVCHLSRCPPENKGGLKTKRMNQAVKL